MAEMEFMCYASEFLNNGTVEAHVRMAVIIRDAWVYVLC